MLEIIAQNLDDIKAINASNADRIEFCVELDKGGLTPPLDLITKASYLARKDLMIMLRLHSDNFYLSPPQLQKLVTIIEQTKHLPFTGYVFGALTKNHEIDETALQAIIKVLPPDKTLTFHKAFDYILDQKKAFQVLKRYWQVQTILTSGPAKQDLLTNLKPLKTLNNHKPALLIGGGVTLANFEQILEQDYFNLHCGQAVRVNNSWNQRIEKDKINEIKMAMQLKILITNANN